MQFTHTWRKVLSGEQTQARIIVKPGEHTNEWHLNGDDDMTINEVLIPRTRVDKYGMSLPRNVYLLGKTYAVQPGRGKRSAYWKIDEDGLLKNTVDLAATYAHWTRKNLEANGWHEARIRILRIWREDVREISESDARAEGGSFAPKYEFLQIWTDMHDPEIDNNSSMSCSLVTEYDPNQPNHCPMFLRRRPVERYDAWALEFELVRP